MIGVRGAARDHGVLVRSVSTAARSHKRGNCVFLRYYRMDMDACGRLHATLKVTRSHTTCAEWLSQAPSAHGGHGGGMRQGPGSRPSLA